MSAIFGVLRFDGGQVAARDMERMADILAYRGPDRRKFVADGPFALGHCLMRVNQEDVFEAQPLCDRDADVTLVADLRLDNRDDLASAFGIGAAELRDMPDSALVMRAYKKWGENCAEKLLGDFVFALWDGRAQMLVLARDHMGQRHFFYHKNENFFVFATDIKALHANPDVPRVLSDVQIGRMLLQERVPRERGGILFDGIYGIPAATVMTIDRGGSTTKRRYWEPVADPAHIGRNESYYIDAYRRVLGEAVACRIRRVVRPPGILFSGGYDSAAIAGLAGPALAASGRKLIAAASVMPADYRGTIRHARPWVEMCARDMPHLAVHYVTREGKNVLSGLDEAYSHGDLPVGPYYFVRRELMSTLAGARVQLFMDGHGGDYTLNPRGQGSLAHCLATFQLRRFFSELPAHMRATGHSFWTTIKIDIAHVLLPPAVLALWRRARRGPAPVWGDEPIAPAFAAQVIADAGIDVTKLRAVTKVVHDSRPQMRKWLQLVMAGAASGYSSLAARHGLVLTRPFYDKRVIELGLAVPQDLDVKNGRSRYLACAALKDVYPREFQTRWRKNDDQIPDFQRMVTSIKPRLLAEIARMERSEKLARYLDFGKIRRLLAVRGPDDHLSGWEQETQKALFGFFAARYLEWFWRDNR